MGNPDKRSFIPDYRCKIGQKVLLRTAARLGAPHGAYQILKSKPSEFEPADTELLRVYATAAAQVRRATEAVAAGDMKALQVQAASTAMMARMAQRLRLGPRGRRPNGTRASGAKAEVSSYDLLP